MPLALLLATPLDAFTKGVKRWRSWQGLADTETLLLARERGRFMTTWFGTTFERRGLAPAVHIDNLGEIHAALRGIDKRRHATVGQPEKASLLEPLLGNAGALVGVMSSPVMALMMGIGSWSKHRYWWQWLGPVLWFLAGPVAAIAGPIALVAILGGKALSGQHDIFTVFQLLAEISGAIDQIFGALSWFVSRVVPLLGPVSDIAVALAGLVSTTIGLLSTIFGQLVGLKDVFRHPLAVAFGGFAAMAIGLRHAFGRLAELRTIGSTAFSRLGKALDEFADEFSPSFVVKQHPLVVALGTLAPATGVLVDRWKELITLLPLWIGEMIVGVASDDDDDKKADPNSTWSKVKGWAWDKFKDLTNMPDAPPELAKMPKGPKLMPFSEAMGQAFEPTDETAAVGKAFEAAGKAIGKRPPSVFAGQRAVVRAAVAKSALPAADVAKYLRIARHAVAPHAAETVRATEDVLRDLDRRLERTPRVYPVRDVVPVQPLHLHVRELVVIGTGRREKPVRDFAEQVRRSMNRQVFELELVS